MDAYDWIICHYGRKAQTEKGIEELDELKIELIRSLNGKANKKNMASEIADVMNIIYQAMKINNISKKEVLTIMKEKTERTLMNIEKELHGNVKKFNYKDD